MLAFLFRRLAAAIVFVLLVALVAFLLGRLAPGDPAAELKGRASQDSIARMRAASGYGQPLLPQLASWLAGVARFDLGRSASGDAVAPLVWDRARNTARLGLLALVIAVLLGIPAGVLSGAHQRGPIAWVLTPISVALVSCPPVVGVLALLWFGAVTGWLSVAPEHIAVPALALALPLAATLERLQSKATADVLASPEWPAAAARGLPPGRLLWVHALRHAVRPVIGVSGVLVAGVFSGSLAVETVTAWPGLARLTYEALVARDLFLVAGCALAGAALIATANFAADVLRAIVDPRVRELA